MSIDRIVINNFTVFRGEVGIDFSGGINVIIGENGTGKTHLLKLLYAFCEEEFVELDDFDDENGQIISCLDVISSDKSFPAIVLSAFSASNSNCLLNGATLKNSEEYPFSINIVIGTGAYTYGFADAEKLLVPLPRYRYPDNLSTVKRLPAVFVPAKDMLTHAGLEKDFTQRNLPFDITLIDILNKAGVSTLKNIPAGMKSILEKIEKIIGGKVLFENNHYFISKEDGSKVSFGAEAEGFKKLGLIYRLIETGNIANGSVLIWDEPEANINPNNIPVLADILLAIQENGVQIFIATHDYFLAKYLNVRKAEQNKILFHSLYKENGFIKHESEEDFDLLENNMIMQQSIKLYKEEVAKVMK